MIWLRVLLICGLLISPIILLLRVLTENDSYMSILKINYNGIRDFNELYMLFYLGFPIIVGLIGIIYLLVNQNILRATGESIALPLIISLLNIISPFWLFGLLFVVALTMYPFRLPLP
jgi:hypothetical protein